MGAFQVDSGYLLSVVSKRIRDPFQQTNTISGGYQRNDIFAIPVVQSSDQYMNSICT